MSNLNEYSTFDQNAFPEQMTRLCEWLEPAKKSGNLSEYRGRTEAIILWLDYLKKSAPVDKRSLLDSLITQLNASIVSMPRPACIPNLPDMPRLNAQDMDERMRKDGEETVAWLKASVHYFPVNYAESISYCLAASKGISASGGTVEYHHLFAFLFRSLAMDLQAQDETAFCVTVQGLQNWGKQTALNRGFDRNELLRCIAIITSFDREGASSAPPPTTMANGLALLALGFFALFQVIKKTHKTHNTIMSHPLVRGFRESLETGEKIRFMSGD